MFLMFFFHLFYLFFRKQKVSLTPLLGPLLGVVCMRAQMFIKYIILQNLSAGLQIPPSNGTEPQHNSPYQIQLYLITLNFFPTLTKAAIASSNCSLLCAAEICTRILASFFGTTGNEKAIT